MHGKQLYPGELATVEQIRMLAGEYRRASHDLLARENGRKASSVAPARLLAMQAVELQLNAFLLHAGYSAQKVRGFQHNLAARGDLPELAGLRLKKRTLAHLHMLSEGREYLATRYGPEMTGMWSELNRLIATLDEITKKVSAAIDRPAATPPLPRAAPDRARRAPASSPPPSRRAGGGVPAAARP